MMIAKNTAGTTTNFKKADSLIINNLLRNPFKLTLASQLPKIIMEITKLVSPTIFTGVSKTEGM